LVVVDVFEHFSFWIVRMQALESWKEFLYEDNVLLLCVTSHVQEYGISIVIANTLVRGIINEKNVVCAKRNASTRIQKELSSNVFCDCDERIFWERTLS